MTQSQDLEMSFRTANLLLKRFCKYDDISDNTLSNSKQLSRDFELMEDGSTKTVYKINTPKTRNSICLIPLDFEQTKKLETVEIS